MKIALIILVALGIGTPAVFMFLSTGTQINVNPPVTVIGFDTPMRVELRNAHGIRAVKVTLEQNGKRAVAFEESKPAHRLTFFNERNGVRDVVAHIGKKEAAFLTDGKARVTIDATSNDLRGQVDSKIF